MSESVPAGRPGDLRERMRGTRLPRVDVVIPCYNYAHFLDQCVRSVLDQPGVEVRVLVIDDKSPDDTPEVMARLQEDPRVHYRRHEVNMGHIATYNEGLLGWADSDYLALLSADDLLAPGALGRAAAVFGSDAGIGMVYGRGVYFSHHDRLPRTAALPLGSTRWSGQEWIEGRCRTARNVISSPEVVVRTSVQHAVGGYRPDLPLAGDLEMWLRIAAVAGIGYVRGRPQAFYRVHGASMTRTVFDAFLSDLEQRRAVFERFFAEHPDVDGAEQLRTAANRALARDALWAACRAYDRDRLDTVPAADLADFARTAYPDVRALPEYGALARRQRLGARFCSRTQIFLAPHAVRQGRVWLSRQAWKWRGV